MFKGYTLLIFICVFLSPLVAVFGQSISPQTVNVGGSYSTVSGFSLDYSIGESSSIALFKFSDNSSLSTGVLQSFTPLVTGITNLSFTEGESITVSPNPASQNLRIKGLLNRPGFIEFHLVDVNGRVMTIDPRSYYINYFDKEINVSSFNEGVYFIRLLYHSIDSDTKSAVFKFIKIQ
jgi:hypothetical protein